MPGIAIGARTGEVGVSVLARRASAKPYGRMLANDDALPLADLLQAAMLK